MPAAPLPRSPAGRRLSPAAARDAAIEAARALLVEHGPQAVTLKAVAARVGRTHANLLHHFGSAEELQRALIARMAADISGTIRDTVLRARSDGQGPREIVDLVFEAFGGAGDGKDGGRGGGAGALASWMILSGNEDALDPVLTAIHDLVDELTQGRADGERPLREDTLHLVLMALGDALLGAPMARALGLPRSAARELALAGLFRRDK